MTETAFAKLIPGLGRFQAHEIVSNGCVKHDVVEIRSNSY